MVPFQWQSLESAPFTVRKHLFRKSVNCFSLSYCNKPWKPEKRVCIRTPLELGKVLKTKINKKFRMYSFLSNFGTFLVREAGLEPARPEWALEPESPKRANRGCNHSKTDYLVPWNPRPFKEFYCIRHSKTKAYFIRFYENVRNVLEKPALSGQHFI